MRVSSLLVAVLEKLQEQERRISTADLRGMVTDVDAATHRIRMEIGETADGDIVKSPWLPVSQPAGALKIHSMPSVGQTVIARSSGGDIRQGVAEPLHWTDENASPSNNPDEHVLTFGDLRIEIVDGGLNLNIGGTSWALSEAGFFQTGGRVDHDEKNIGSDHTHRGVIVGDDDTKEPNP